jgi:hypothetical protein
MPAPNSTGLPRTTDYFIGRGKLYFAPLTNGIPGAYRDLGNAPSFSISVEVETLEHQSSREGLKTVDTEVVISQKVTANFTLDEVNAENIAEFLSGESSTHTNAAIAGFAEHQMITNVVLGRWYDIKNAAGERAYDIDSADLTVEKQGAPDVPLVENTDYTLDLVMGRIFFLSTAVNCAAGDEIDVTLAADANAAAVTEVRALTQTTVSGALKFIAVNPNDGDKETEFQFHQVKLKGDGEFALISDEFASMSFTAAAERNETADADSPTLTIRTHVNS